MDATLEVCVEAALKRELTVNQKNSINLNKLTHHKNKENYNVSDSSVRCYACGRDNQILKHAVTSLINVKCVNQSAI